MGLTIVLLTIVVVAFARSRDLVGPARRNCAYGRCIRRHVDGRAIGRPMVVLAGAGGRGTRGRGSVRGRGAHKLKGRKPRRSISRVRANDQRSPFIRSLD